MSVASQPPDVTMKATSSYKLSRRILNGFVSPPLLPGAIRRRFCQALPSAVSLQMRHVACVSRVRG